MKPSRSLPASSLYVSATQKSSGKTVIALGLCAALRARGLTVQPFKKGPDYIDPLWLGLAAGRECHNLDFHTMSSAEIRALFERHGATAELRLVEGNKGLYDGVDVAGTNSNAALAHLLATPVILVIDTRGMTRGIAPLVHGYRTFDPSAAIAGVILNRVGGPRHESKLRSALERYTDVPVLGAVGRYEALAIAERHLGLLPANEAPAARETVAAIGARIEADVDIERTVAVTAPATEVTCVPAAPAGDLRLGVMRDAAFGFYYPGDLEGLRAAGAELVTIDSLRDAALPEIDGLFIGGGFPEMHMDVLQANRSLRRSIRARVESGMPVYAECGGLMYLARRIRWGGRRADMVGVIEADAVIEARPQGRGYAVLRETGASPWPALCDAAASDLPVHEFHYSRLVDFSREYPFAYEVVRGHGIDGAHDGLVHHNVLASYTHLRNVEACPWARRFVEFVRAHKARPAVAWA